MNAKDSVSVTDSIEVELSNLTPEQIAAVRKKFGSLVNHPCPKCGRESRRYQRPGGCTSPDCPHEEKQRICTAATCRTVFRG